jgi:choline dehydrogenase-like flavoprotein
LARAVSEYVFRGRGFTPNPAIAIAIVTEQEPNPSSRIHLGGERDALGMRKAVVHWQLTDLTLRTISVFAELWQRELARIDLGRLTLADWLVQGSSSWRDHVGDLNHHMGSTRMASSPERGVVDPSCRVHGIDNLWIASSSVFPTGGHSNPTLTILALAIRLSDELKRRLCRA